MDDLISRQAAIDAIDEYMVGKNCATDGTMMASLINELVIKRLPSTQSEIILCKDCKHKPSGNAAEHDITFPDDKCPCQCEDYWYSWIPSDDWYCGFAERRGMTE